MYNLTTIQSDNASNFKNEIVLKFLKEVNVPGRENPSLKIKAFIPNEAGDGKVGCPQLHNFYLNIRQQKDV